MGISSTTNECRCENRAVVKGHKYPNGWVEFYCEKCFTRIVWMAPPEASGSVPAGVVGTDVRSKPVA